MPALISTALHGAGGHDQSQERRSMKSRIEKALPAGQRGQGRRSKRNSNLTSTPYHAQNETANYFRSKRLADATARSDFRRTDLAAAEEAQAAANRRRLYAALEGISTSNPDGGTRLSWFVMGHSSTRRAISTMARLLRTKLALEPGLASRLGSSTDLPKDLRALFKYKNVAGDSVEDVVEGLLLTGFVSVEKGTFIVHADDHVADGFPTGQTTIDKFIRAKVLLRDGLVCQICLGEITETYDLDHIIPVAEGGLDTIENLRVAHRSCNRSRAGDVRYRRFGKYGKQPNLNRGVR